MVLFISEKKRRDCHQRGRFLQVCRDCPCLSMAFTFGDGGTMVSHSIFKCSDFLACRLRHIFHNSLTVCTSSIFGGEPDIKVQIFSGFSSPDFRGEVKKNTLDNQFKTQLLDGLILCSPHGLHQTKQQQKQIQLWRDNLCCLPDGGVECRPEAECHA